MPRGFAESVVEDGGSPAVPAQSGQGGVGGIAILTEQNARKALEVAGYGYVLSGGNVVLEDPTSGLRANDAVVHAYLRAQPSPPV